MTRLRILRASVDSVLRMTNLQYELRKDVVTNVAKRVDVHVIFYPVVTLVPDERIIVQTIVLSPRGAFQAKVPVLFARPLRRNKGRRIIPIAKGISTVHVTERHVSSRNLIAIIIRNVVTMISRVIAIRILSLRVSQVNSTLK